jgi:UDP-2,4-diacetamido-2,4,6-trideoxy-beta-L-altropyranose hydrolase
MTILRVDFSGNIGFGHLKRIERYTKQYIKNDVLIVCKECEQKYTDIPIVKIKNEEEFFEKVKELQPDSVIVDNYNFAYENEKQFKNLFPDIKLIVFDDIYQKHFADEIINVNLYAKKEKYNSNAKITILKPLLDEKIKNLNKKHFKKEGIFISFGATDAKGIGLKVLKMLKNKKLKVNFYTTSANKHLNKLRKFCFLNKWCKLHIDEDVLTAMAKAKFGIITPSTIAYEALAIKLPFVAVEIADNQKLITKFLKQKRIKVLNTKEIRKIYDFIPNK